MCVHISRIEFLNVRIHVGIQAEQWNDWCDRKRNFEMCPFKGGTNEQKKNVETYSGQTGKFKIILVQFTADYCYHDFTQWCR